MKMFTRTLSTLLAVLMILGSMVGVLSLSVGAATTDGKTDGTEEEPTASTIDYVKEVFEKPEDALKYMTPYLENDNYIMYFNDYTAVFALVNKHTGHITFSNPYDVASSQGSDKTKQAVLSQVLVKYVDNGQTKDMNSYFDAALNEQIAIKRIKGGVRVEYIIGNEATRKLVPRLISREHLVDLILKPLAEALGITDVVNLDGNRYAADGSANALWDPVNEIIKLSAKANSGIPHAFSNFASYFESKNLAAQTTAKGRKSLLAQYPICEKMAVYALDVNISTVELNKMEELIKGYCPDYTFDQMDADHDETGYESENELSPVFKLALEYFLNDDGFSVRQPTNGLRYNTTLYSIESLTILPYMGAGNSYNTGYTFYPDGSGALFCFEDLSGKSTFTTSRKLYGADYAYHTLDGTYQKALRMPVFGIKSDNSFYTYTTTNTVENDDGTETVVETPHIVSVTVEKNLEALIEKLDKAVADGVYESHSDVEKVTSSSGFFAVIEEGESLCQLATYHAGSLSDYHTIMTNFNPRPKDSYDISDSISVTSSSTMTIVSDRKYTGNLKIRYIMLDSDSEGDGAGASSYYQPDYVGMADAYTNYLMAQGVLKRLTDKDVSGDIPLYIESFGALEVTEQILSFPVDVMKPLTTFEDIRTMYEDLSGKGVKNINFKLTGFANGGMYSIVPSKVKWEKSVGGKKGFVELLKYAQEVNQDSDKNLALYPDFDFLYINYSSFFDGVKLKRDAIRTIDNRYTSKQLYSATQQKYISYYQLALSPAYIDRFYNKLINNYAQYLDYNALGISVSTLGTDLSSDFDEDEPYNREDNKKFLRDALAALSSMEGSRGLMTDGGNAYTLGYVDHLLNVSLDSSRFMKASYSIPFAGMVLHGYVQFAGTPLNMEGDTNYALLKAIENGASPYFILSFRNTNEIKEYYLLSRYYSVNYNIWKDDVVSYYTELNQAIGDLQTKRIIGHSFLTGTRVLDISEIETEVEAQRQKNDAYESSYEETVRMEKIIAIANARAAAKNAVQTMKDTLEELTADAKSMESAAATIERLCKTCESNYKKYIDAVNNPKMLPAQVKMYLRSYNNSVNEVKDKARGGIQLALDAEYAYETVLKLHATAANAVVLLTEDGAAEELIEDARACAAEAETYLAAIKEKADYCMTFVDGIYEAASKYVSRDTIDALLDKHEEKAPEEETKEETSSLIHISDKGNLVAVTYGGKNGNDADPYKTFILNYNNYSVTVEYEVDGRTMVYTIPANHYVVIRY